MSRLLEAWACSKVVALARPRYLDRRLQPRGNVFVVDTSTQGWHSLLQEVEEQSPDVEAVARQGYRAYQEQFTHKRALQRWHDTLHELVSL